MNKIVRLEPLHNNMNMPGVNFAQMSSMEDKIIAAIKTVYDPEIPVNIYDLGLIYKIDISDDNTVHIDMTLTAPACPVADILPGQVATVVRQLDEVNDVKVELVFDPPWTTERMSEEAKLLLNML
ncbi:MAG: FeS assembly SUF system protein [Gammaproteobacteria bacterium SG8_11]|nr:MAG: FeS assembly SUF system protein [Gammaproteobacteria bacterium SG8_11]